MGRCGNATGTHVRHPSSLGLHLSGSLWTFPADEVASGAWTRAYPALFELQASRCIVPFASDAFGDLWVSGPGGVSKLTTETCELVWVAPDLDAWEATVLADPDIETGKAFLEGWTARNGGLPVGDRLTPKVPFALGGGYGDSNLVAMDLRDILAFRSHFAVLTHGLADGSRVLLDTSP